MSFPVQNFIDRINNADLFDLSKEMGQVEFKKGILELFGNEIGKRQPSMSLLLKCIVLLPPSQDTVEKTAMFLSKTQGSTRSLAHALWDMIMGTAETGNLTTMKLAFEKLAELEWDCKDLKDQDNQTPLHLAAKYGHDEVAEFLIGKGFKINAKDLNGNTPLHLAAEGTNVRLIALLAAGVHERNNKGRTPIFMVKNTDVFTALIQNGANVRVHDQDGRNPLHHAYRSRNQEIISLMLQNQALFVHFDKFVFLPCEYGQSNVSDTIYTKLRDLAKSVRDKKEADFKSQIENWDNGELIRIAYSNPSLHKLFRNAGFEKEGNYRVYGLPGDRTHLLSVSTPQQQMEVLSGLSQSEKDRELKSKIYVGQKAYKTPQEILQMIVQGFNNLLFINDKAVAVFGEISPLAIALLAQDEANRANLKRLIHAMNKEQLAVFMPHLSPAEWIVEYRKMDEDLRDFVNGCSTPAQLQQLTAADIIGGREFETVPRALDEMEAKPLVSEEEKDKAFASCFSRFVKWQLALGAFELSFENPHLGEQKAVVDAFVLAQHRQINALKDRVHLLMDRIQDQ